MIFSKITGFYLWLQLKKSIRLMIDALFSVLFIVIVMCGSALLVKALLQNQNQFEKVKVGIAITDGSRETRNVFRLLYAMESVNNICTFTYVEPDAVNEELSSGKLKAVLVIAPDFYDDVNNGKNTPVKLLLGEDKDFETSFFYELVMDGCKLIRITEAAIYATSDVMEIYETRISVEDMQDLFSRLYVESILRRYDTFKGVLLSPTGDYDLSQHYSLTLFSVLLLMCGLHYGMLYRQEELLIFQVLKREGFTHWHVSGVKTGAMAIQLWLIALSAYGIGCLACEWTQSSLFIWHGGTVFLLGLVAIGMAAYFHMIFGWCGNSEKSGMLIFVLNVFMLFLSGALLPVSCMPAVVEKIQGALPLSVWWKIMGAGFFGGLHWQDVLKAVLQIMIFEMIGALGVCRRI